MTSAYGRIVTGGHVVAAVRSTIETWIASYCAEMGRVAGLTLPPPTSYGASAPPGYPAEKLPRIVVVAPGVIGDPDRRGGGLYDAVWAIGVGVIVADPREDRAFDLCQAYTAAVRALLLQNGSLGGFAEGVTWVDEEVTRIEWDESRVVVGGSVFIEALVRNVVDGSKGLTAPPSPDPTIPVGDIQVQSTHVTVTRSL